MTKYLTDIHSQLTTAPFVPFKKSTLTSSERLSINDCNSKTWHTLLMSPSRCAAAWAAWSRLASFFWSFWCCNKDSVKPVNPVHLNISLTNRFQVAMGQFSNRSQMTSKCGKNKKVAHEAQPSVSLMFLPHFDVICDLLLNRHTATWNLFVLYNKELKKC